MGEGFQARPSSYSTAARIAGSGLKVLRPNKASETAHSTAQPQRYPN